MQRFAVYSSVTTVDLYRYISVIYFYTASYAVTQLVRARHKRRKVARSITDGVIRTFYSHNSSSSQVVSSGL